MKKHLIKQAGKLVLIPALSLLTFNVTAQQPNIIVIVTDDAGYADWGFQGSEVCETPNIDDLRSEGIYFSQAYVTMSVCAPSRAGLLTGRYQSRFGFDFNIVDYYPTPGRTDADVGMDPNEKTIGNYLKDLGYKTSAIGKWHLGKNDHHHPNRRGFDYFYGLLSGSRPYFHTNDLPEGQQLMRNQEFDDMTEGYMTDVLTDDALQWMYEQNSNGDAPFFTYLSYTAIHGPYESKQEDYDYFTDNCIGFDGEACTDVRQNYVAMAYSLDYNIGKLVDSLKAWDIFDNTLLFFINDNGGKSPKEITSNGVLRDGKSSQYEGGLRVPFFCVWPGKFPQNTEYSKQVISLDIAPTIIKAAGGDLPVDIKLDGVDLLPVVIDSTLTAHEYLFWRKFETWVVAKKETDKLIIKYKGVGDADNDTSYHILNSEGKGEWLNRYPAGGNSITSDLLQNLKSWESEMINPWWVTKYFLNNYCGGVDNHLECEFVDSVFNSSNTSSTNNFLRNSSLGIFPNLLHSYENMTIRFPDEEEADLMIYDTSGRLRVQQKVRNNQSFQPANLGLTSGIFICRLMVNSNPEIFKVSNLIIQQ